MELDYKARQTILEALRLYGRQLRERAAATTDPDRLSDLGNDAAYVDCLIASLEGA